MAKSIILDVTRAGVLTVPRLLFVFMIVLVCIQGHCFEEKRSTVTQRAPLTTSLRLEMEAAIAHGASFLSESQTPRGSWGDNPCVTAMAVMAYTNASRSNHKVFSHFMIEPDDAPPSSDGNSPAEKQRTRPQNSVKPKALIQNALDYLVSCLQQDGSITNERTAQYNVLSTAICLQALAAHPEKGTYTIAMRESLAYLIRNQSADGGFPPNREGNSNLGTTLYVMEALYLCALNTSIEEVDIAAALTQAGTYISRQITRENPECPSSLPGMPSGPTSQTVSIARGLIYAGAGPGSEDLRKALTQLDHQFSVTENPGLGQRGYYTYLLSALKTFRICEQVGIDLSVYPRLKNWRNESARELMKRQNGFGRWRKGQSDWWENNPEIVTANVMFSIVNILL